MNILEKLGGSFYFYRYLIPAGLGSIPIMWHIWKNHIWPVYSEMLEALIKQELSHEKCNAVSESIVKIIEKATGKKWDKIKEIINE